MMKNVGSFIRLQLFKKIFLSYIYESKTEIFLKKEMGGDRFHLHFVVVAVVAVVVVVLFVNFWFLYLGT